MLLSPYFCCIPMSWLYCFSLFYVIKYDFLEKSKKLGSNFVNNPFLYIILNSSFLSASLLTIRILLIIMLNYFQV